MTTKKEQPTKEKAKLNLYQKLILVRKEVEYMQKDSDGYKFRYASDTAIIGAIRPKMDELGIFLDQEMVSVEVVGAKTIKVDFLYRWINAENPTEIIERKQTMFDHEASEQGLGKAMTYGMRYFLYKSFLVATADDDPDAHQSKLLARRPKPSLNKQQIDEIMALMGGRQDIYDGILSHYKVGDIGAIAADQHTTLINGIKARLNNG